MVQRPFGAQDVDEAEVRAVAHRMGECGEGVQPPDDLEPPHFRLPDLGQHREGHSSRRGEVAPALLGDPREDVGLTGHLHAEPAEELLEVGEGERRVDQVAERRREAAVHHPHRSAVLRPEVAHLRLARRADRCQVRHQLGPVPGDRLHHHRVGAPDQGAPGLVVPEVEVGHRDQLVADDAPRHHPESRRLTGVHHLLGLGGVEVRRRLRRQDQRPYPPGRDRGGPRQVPVSGDRAVGTSGDTLAAADTGVVFDPYERLFHRNGTDRTNAYAGEAADTGLGQYGEHRYQGVPEGPGSPGEWTT